MQTSPINSETANPTYLKKSVLAMELQHSTLSQNIAEVNLLPHRQC